MDRGKFLTSTGMGIAASLTANVWSGALMRADTAPGATPIEIELAKSVGRCPTFGKRQGRTGLS